MVWGLWCWPVMPASWVQSLQSADFFFSFYLGIFFKAFKKAGTREHMDVASNFWPLDVRTICAHKLAVALHCPNLFWQDYKGISENSLYLRKFSGEKNFFLHVKKKFFFNFFSLIPVKTFQWDHKLTIFAMFGFSKKINTTPINSVCKGLPGRK